MRGIRVVLVLLLVLFNREGSSQFTTPIKHVVVLMLENRQEVNNKKERELKGKTRSFDHMLGYSNHPGLDGLIGNETNPYNTSDPSAGHFTVSNSSRYVGLIDPCHEVPCTTQKIYGGCCNDTSQPKMWGFIEYESEAHPKDKAAEVMEMFTPDKLPILTSLVENYALFDQLHASVPGPTWPNRLFALSGTSMGCTKTSSFYRCGELTPFPQKTIYDSVEEAGLTWRNYFSDVPWEFFFETILKPEHWGNIKDLNHFYADAAAGTLPHFAWINPRAAANLTTGEGSNDQHPDHDVALGEKLIKDIYEAIRASPQWNETLLVITYDEHGGYYDHVPPATNIPPPGDNTPPCPVPFSFDRLGIRVPTLLVSPWVEKGLVIHKPNGPQPNSQFELTSIIGTVKQMFSLPSFLTKRDEWAGKFDEFLTQRDSPRTDCPTKLPDAPKELLSASEMKFELSQPINELQAGFIEILENLTGDSAAHLTSQYGVSDWLLAATNKFLSGNGRIKKPKQNSKEDL